MNKRKQKSIRALEHNAQQGSIKALFQLAKNYKEGQNDELANLYFEKVLNILKKQKLQITSIRLIDFRIFKNCEIDFCTQDKCGSNLTVIIGNNGAGKTTIVDAIAYSLSWVAQRIVRKEGNGDLIDKNHDIHINRNKELSEYASILTKIELSDVFDMELSSARDGGNALRRNYMTEITQLADIYKYANSQDSLFNLPIMAVYSAERALDISKKDLKSFDEVSNIGLPNKFDAYKKKDTFNGKADFQLFFQWFKKTEDNYNAAFIEAIKASNSSKVNDELVSNTYQQSIDHILKAISLCLPDFSNLRIQRTPTLGMLVDKGDVTLSVLQLSQGEKTLMALVADIVRRLIILNPSGDPLKGSGIVLIDEIDLHLHPKWQQSIVPNLLKTFPNIQFIVTTHSPQVLSTVAKKCIRVLGVNNDGDNIAEIPKAESYGEPSNNVLQSIMRVDPQPPVPEKVLLDELTSLVEQGQYEPQRDQMLLTKLKKYLNNNHPQILKIERSIRRQEMLKR